MLGKDRLSRPWARTLTVIFVTVHILVTFWWMIPATGFGNMRSTHPIHSWLHEHEAWLFEMKRKTMASPAGELAMSYLALTGSRQKWWMFAPDPADSHERVVVRAVSEFEREGQARPRFTGEPLYESSPAGALPTNNQLKLADALSSGKYPEALRSFARYWGRVYRDRTGSYPAAIQVYSLQGPIIPAPRVVAHQQVTEVLLWSERF